MVKARSIDVGNDDPNQDAGLTLVELLVSMAVFAIFITILLSSILGITRASTQAQVISRAASGALIVFQNFDREIRYADAINYPGSTASGRRYVEFRTPASSSIDNVTTCNQWRFSPGTGLLESRKWVDTIVPTPTPTPWVTRLSVVFDDGANYPFTVQAAGVGSAMQQLTLSIDAGNAVQRGSAIKTNFVARNSGIGSDSNANVLSAGASGARVCTTADRPQ